MTPGARLGNPRLRLFVALELPGSYLDELVQWQESAFAERGDLRLVSRFSLHVTLVFLGYQRERDIERIAETSFAGGRTPFELSGEDVLEVPPRKPRLYALSLNDPGDALKGWQGALSDRLAEAGLYKPEKRPFWPHVTIARFKREGTRRDGGPSRARRSGHSRPGGPRGPEPMPELPDELRVAFRAERLSLYSSTLRPQGAQYERLTSIDLGEPAAKPEKPAAQPESDEPAAPSKK